ncbi:MAG: hypothetical protein JSS02_12650 [Planctomycetes bacterium]|nr:hypothetical protein [Planctomycetota bacterium]
MSLIDLHWTPTDRQLKQFGGICLIALPVLGWVATGRPRSVEAANIPLLASLAGVGLLFAMAGFLKPQILKWPFVITSLIAFPIGLVVSEVAQLLIFLLVFTPIALIFRLIGRDSLQRTIDRQASSYWQPKRQPRDLRSYYRQF